LNIVPEEYLLLGKALFPAGFPNRSEFMKAERIIETMESAHVLFYHAFESPVCVKEVNPIEMEPIVFAAQANMIQNIAVVREIADVAVQDLYTFWRDVKLLEFDGRLLGSVLSSLSSMDGSRVYISKKAITNSDQLVGQQALEFEYANSLSRWGKCDPYLVSACIDRNLRAVDCPDAVVGAGHFYEERVHTKRASIPSPFDLNCITTKRE